MKKAIAVTCIAVMCAGAFTACSDNSDTTTTSSSTTTSSGSSATVASDIVASDPTMDYVTGDYDYEDCLEIPEYKNLELTKTVTTITDDYVSDYIASSLTAEEVDDADAVVEDGDVVTIECTATSDGEAASSLSTTSSDSDSSDSTDSSSSDDSTAETTDVEIGSNTYPDGFDDKIIGMKADEEKSFTITVADDYATEELQGKDVDFTVKVTAISRYPELTDDWVNEQTDGEYTTLSDYQKALKESLQSSQDENSEAQLQSDAWSAVYDKAEFKKLPKEYVEDAMDAFDESSQQYADQYGMDFVDFLEQCDMTTDDYAERKREYGEEQAKILVLIDAICDKEGLSEKDDVYQEYLQDLCDYYSMTEEELKEAYGEDIVNQACAKYNVCEKIISYAKVTETESES